MSDDKRRRLTPEDIGRICEMRENGRTYAAIAKALECSVGAVKWQCLRNGADSPRTYRSPAAPRDFQRGGRLVRHYTAEEDARLLALEAEGLGVCEIGRRLQRRHNSVVGRLATLARAQERAANG